MIDTSQGDLGAAGRAERPARPGRAERPARPGWLGSAPSSGIAFLVLIRRSAARAA
jgi:hypothetical protein